MSAVTKADLKTLGDLALNYGHARAVYAQALERAHHEPMPPSRLTALSSAEEHAWGKYRDLHFELLTRVEGEEFAEVVAGVERPTIYTLEELDALPDDAVVLDADGVMTYQNLGDGHWSGDARSWQSAQIKLPATVIWRREES